MDKYRRVALNNKDKTEKVQGPENEIRVTAKGRTATYISYASKLFNEKEMDSLTVKATGTALSTAVTVAEIIKRRIKGLHQLVKLGSVEITEQYEPLEEGLDPVSTTRMVSFIEIHLSKQDLSESDNAAVGYQAPLDDSLVKEMDPEEIARPRSARANKGKGKKGRGKKGSAAKKILNSDENAEESEETVDETPKKGSGKGRKGSKSRAPKKASGADDDGNNGESRKPGKGKGKGKGKFFSKGKGKGKGGSGFFFKGKGKGKGKGKKGSKGKGKGKGTFFQKANKTDDA